MVINQCSNSVSIYYNEGIINNMLMLTWQKIQ